MAAYRGIDDPSGGGHAERIEQAGAHEQRRSLRSRVLAGGTLACPDCDAPVAPHRPLSPSERIACPLCGIDGAVRDFLSLDVPTRPAHVQVVVTGFELHTSS